MRSILLSLLLAATAHAQYFGAYLLHDGNYHDKDDWASLAMELALGEGQPGLLGCTINCHEPQSLPAYEAQMQTSVDGGCDRFGENRGLFYSRDAAALVPLINRASSRARLLVVLAGPAELLWQAKQAADPSHWRYVTVMSHSRWNETHKEPGTHTLADCQPAAVWRIPDQNARLRTDYSRWTWLKLDARLAWVYDRAVATGKAQFDVSDAGMIFTLLTGNQTGTPEDFRAQFRAMGYGV